MSRFLSLCLRTLAPYTPGEQPKEGEFIKLNTNESPFPPSPRVMEALGPEAAAGLRLYSDPGLEPLRSAAARCYNLSPDMVTAGNGSDEVLSFAFQAFCLGGRVVFPDVTYGFYGIWAALYGVEARRIPLREDFTLNPADYYEAGGTVLIANPNAPTGLALTRDQMEGIVARNPGNVVIVDEAYVDFGGESCLPLLERYDNLLITRTFSKSRSLAGARLGLALGSPALIEDLERVRNSFNPYNLGRLPLLAGAAALEDKDYLDACVEKIIALRQSTAAALNRLGAQSLPSRTNFLFVRCPGLDGAAYCAALRQRKVLVRHFPGPRTGGYVRVTIGGREEMEHYLDATLAIIEEGSK